MRLAPALRVLVPVMGLTLIGSTWRLWFPVTEFPMVPLVGWLVDVPRWVHFAACSGLVGSLVALGSLGVLNCRGRLERQKGERWCWIATAATALFLTAAVLLNQHRLQVWAWHLFLLLPVLLVRTDEETKYPVLEFSGIQSHLLTLTAGIYVWSAFSRVDEVFFNTVGPQMLEAFGTKFPTPVRFWIRGHMRLLVITLPLVEMLIALLIALRTSRRYGLWLSLAMHCLLLYILGPFGLDHKPGVLVWNAWFLLQNGLLLWFQRYSRIPGEQTPDASDSGATVKSPSGPAHWTDRLAFWFLAAVLLTPALRFADRFDNWPSWAVYSPGASRTLVMIHDQAARELPGDMRRYLIANFDNPEWSWFRLDQWSLEALDAPSYPQDRFQAAVAVHLARKYGLGESIRVRHESKADVLNGQRGSKTLSGQEAIEKLARSFWFNAIPVSDP